MFFSLRAEESFSQPFNKDVSMFWAFPVGPGFFCVLSCAAPRSPKLSSWAKTGHAESGLRRDRAGRLLKYFMKSWNTMITSTILQQYHGDFRENDFTFVPRRHSKVFFYHMGTAEERMRRKAGSNLDVTVAATNWTSNRDVIFCSIFKHTMKVWCWSPKNCIFDVRCWMLADSGTASWCEVGCDACIFSAVGCGAFGNPPEEHVWEIGWSGWNASEISMPFF